MILKTLAWVVGLYVVAAAIAILGAALLHRDSDYTRTLMDDV